MVIQEIKKPERAPTIQRIKDHEDIPGIQRLSRFEFGEGEFLQSEAG